MVEHLSKEAGSLLSILAELHLMSIIDKPYIVWQALIGRGKVGPLQHTHIHTHTLSAHTLAPGRTLCSRVTHLTPCGCGDSSHHFQTSFSSSFFFLLPPPPPPAFAGDPPAPPPLPRDRLSGLAAAAAVAVEPDLLAGVAALGGGGFLAAVGVVGFFLVEPDFLARFGCSHERTTAK